MTLETYAQSPMTISTDFTVDYGDRRKGETMIWEAKNFDENESNTTTLGVWTDSNPQVVANLDKNGINKNDKCLKLTCSDANGFFKMRLPSGFNLNGRRRISMLYKGMGKEFYAQLELVDEFTGGGSNTWKLGAYQDVEGWKRLYFDFTPYDEGTGTGYINVADEPDVLVFKPKIKDKNYDIQNSTAGDVYYIDEIKVEDVPYAEGYWIHDNVQWPKGTFDAGATPKWNTDNCKLPTDGSNGVLHLSGTWLKGRNIVNPDCETANTVSDPKSKAGYWVYEFNEYRDLSWHVKPEEVKLMVFKNDSKLRWPDRGGLLGTNTGTPEAAAGYPDRFINNLNVLIFAEKSCILPDEVDNLAANWHDINAVIHYSNDDSWKAWELELTDNYPFLNPQEFTVENLIKIHRGMKEGFNALVYPFSLTADELHSSRVGTIYHHKDANKLYFVPKTATEANVPYITENLTYGENTTSKIKKDYQEIPAGSRTVSTVDETYAYASKTSTGTLHGVYQETNGKDKWGLAGGVFKKGGANSYFKTFRAYLDFPAGSAAKMFSSFNLEMMELTGVSMTDANNKDNNSDYVYDLYGRRYPRTDLFKGNLPRQIYIVDGKKVIK